MELGAQFCNRQKGALKLLSMHLISRCCVSGYFVSRHFVQLIAIACVLGGLIIVRPGEAQAQSHEEARKSNSLTLALFPRIAPAGTATLSGPGAEIDTLKTPVFPEFSRILHRNVLEGLVYMTPTGLLKPGLAKSWKERADGLRIRVTLKSGVVLNDGHPVTSEFVIAALGRMQTASPELFRAIKRFKVIDEMRFDIVLRFRDGWLFEKLAGPAGVIVSHSSGRHVFGTGPYQVEAVSKTEMSLTPNPLWRGKTKAKLSKLVVKLVPNSKAALKALEVGYVDAVAGVETLDILQNFQKPSPTIKQVNELSAREVALFMNHRRPFFQSLENRKAVAHSLRRRAILRAAMPKALGGKVGHVIGSHMPPFHSSYTDWSAFYPYGLDKARALLTAPQALTLVTPDQKWAQRASEVIAQQLGKVGLQIKRVVLDGASWHDRVRVHHNFDLALGIFAEDDDIIFFSHPDNFSGYDNTYMRQVIEKMNTRTRPILRMTRRSHVQRHLAVDVAAHYLFQLPNVGYWPSKVRGIPQSTVTGTLQMESLSW